MTFKEPVTELAPGRRGKRFAALMYLLRGMATKCGWPLSPEERRLLDALWDVERLSHCYAEIADQDRPLSLIFRTSRSRMFRCFSRRFERAGHGLILACSDFADMPREGRWFMGVVNVVRMLDGRYLLTFDGSSLANDRLAQIFAAVSSDGETFEPLNGGYPIFTARRVKSRSVTRVANPRITVLERDSVYMLSFNGHYQSGLYGIGLTFTRDFKEWWEHPGNLVLAPSGSPTTDPFSGRIEGGALLKENPEDERRDVRMFVTGIPRKGLTRSAHGDNL